MPHFLYHSDMDSPSLRQLDIFAQMVAAGSLVRCARYLDMPVSHVAAEIEALEKRLGYRLFDDLERSARLTDAGHKTAKAMTLLSHDQPDTWQQVNASEEAVGDTRTPEVTSAPSVAPTPPSPSFHPQRPARTTITLAAPAPVFGHFQDALAAFEAANDDIVITLDLHVQTAAEAARAFALGKADIAYFYAIEAPVDLPSRYGWSEQLTLYAGDAHPLSRLDSVSREALSITPLLAMERNNGMRGVIEAALDKGRAPTGPIALESDDLAAILTALRDGAGIFAAFGPFARDLGRMTGIRRLLLDSPLPSIEIRQAVASGSNTAPAVEALAEFLFL